MRFDYFLCNKKAILQSFLLQEHGFYAKINTNLQSKHDF